MKATTFTFLLFFLFSILKAHCPEGNLQFNNQSQIDQFLIDYPNCEEIKGNIVVHAFSTVHNLNGLQNLKRITGNLYILEKVRSAVGLDSLEYVGGYLSIHNTYIKTMNNLFPSLTTVGTIYLKSNPLEYINDFNYLTQAKEIIIDAAPTTTGEILTIEGFGSLTKINGSLTIWNLYNYVKFSGFENLEEIEGGLFLWCPSNELYNFTELKKMGGDAVIYIMGLTNFSLESLISVKRLTIKYATLESLWGIQNTEFSLVDINSNSSLSFCSTPNICEHLRNGGDAIFNNNGPGCNSVQEVLDNCNMSIDSQELNSKIDIYPNPIKTDLNISLKDNNLKVNKISLYDLTGKLMKEFGNQKKLNLSFYPNGNYVIVIHTDKGFISKKVSVVK